MPKTITRERTNEDWLRDLRADGPAQYEAFEDLRDYLMRAVFVYLYRKRADLSHLDSGEVEQLAQDFVQDALIRIHEELDSFRGESKFTTWAYRVVINAAATELRLKRWDASSLEQMTEEQKIPRPEILEDMRIEDLGRRARQQEVWEVIQDIVDNGLTERQRTALVNAQFHGMPTAKVAEILDTNKNNVYKIIHDARKRLKEGLLGQGLDEDYILSLFQAAPSTT